MKDSINKRIIAIVVCVFISVVSVLAQTVKKHIVERGETLRAIADMYGTTEEKIKDLNPDTKDLVYVGMELTMPSQEIHKMPSTVVQNNIRNDYVAKADAAFKKKKYKSAAKYYGLAIEEKPSATLYFNRALSHYNRTKYNDAIEDFRNCMNSNPTSSMAERARNLIAKAQQYQEEKDRLNEARGQALFGLIMAGTNMYVQNKAQKMQQSRGKSVSVSNNSSDSYSNEDSGYSVPHSTSSKKICRTCKGDGKCMGCHGTGYRTDNHFGTGVDYSNKCGVCGGNGICNICGGSGYKN